MIDDLTQYIDSLVADLRQRIQELEAQVLQLELKDAEKAGALTAVFTTDDLSQSIDALAIPVAGLYELQLLERELVNAGSFAPAAIRVMHGDNARQNDTSIWVWDSSRGVWIVLIGATISPLYRSPDATSFLIENSAVGGESTEEVGTGAYQTFLTPANAVSINSVAIYASVNQEMTIELRLETVDSSGNASGTLVSGASEEGMVQSGGGFKWISMSFDAPVSIQPQTQYALKAIEKTDGTLLWAIDDIGEYPGGGSSAGSNRDFIFRVTGTLGS